MTMRVSTLVVFVTGLLFGTPWRADAQPSLGPISGVLTGHIGTATGHDGAGTTLSLGGSVAVVEQTGWGAEFDAGFASDDGGRTGGLNCTDLRHERNRCVAEGPFPAIRDPGRRRATCPHLH